MDGRRRYRNGLAVLAGSLISLLLGGCLMPYAIPKVERTPKVDFYASEAGARAFRVEETRYYSHLVLSLPIREEYDIREIPVENSLHVAAQKQFCVNRGLGLPGMLLMGDGKHVLHDLEVWIYRPGYRTVRLRQGESFDWVKPVHLDEQGADLMRLCEIVLMPRTNPVCPEHRKVMEFFATECEQIANEIEREKTTKDEEIPVQSVADSVDSADELEKPKNYQSAKLIAKRNELLRAARRVNPEGPNAQYERAEEATEVLKKLLEDAGRKGLPGLMGDPDTTISLAAAWEHAVGPGTKAQPPQPKEFVKFFERRTGVKVPIEWEYELVLAGANVSPDWSRLQTAAQEEYEAAVQAEKSKANKATVWLNDGIYEFADGKTTVRIPAANLPKPSDMSGQSIEAHVGPERTFVAFCDDYGSPFPLVCLDSQTGREVWRTKVWTTRSWPVFFSTGPPRTHYLEFCQVENRLVLFGYAGGCYAAAFDIENGRVVFHFTPDHWFRDSTADMARWRRNLRR